MIEVEVEVEVEVLEFGEGGNKKRCLRIFLSGAQGRGRTGTDV